MDPINRQEELLANAGWVIRAKFVLGGSMLVTFGTAHLSGFLEFPLALFCVFPILEMCVNLPHHWLLRRVKNPERVFTITSALDILIVTCGAYTLGDLGKFLALLLYPLVFIFAGTVMEPKKTYFYANLGWLSLAALSFMEQGGILTPVSTLMLDFSSMQRAALLLLVFPMYNFMAYFVWYLSGILHKRERQLVRRMFHDDLTRLPSRELFVERLRQALARAEAAKREGREEYLFAVLFLDLDRFKTINSTFGHAIGDTLLIEAARRLETCVKSIDTVAHIGGDEYTILLEDFSDERVPARVAERIQEELSLPFDLAGHEAFTSASIGIALSGIGYDSPDDILRDAHTAMYRAKTQGKARYDIFDAKMRPRVVARMELETDLRHAIEQEQFFLNYQPIVELTHETLIGFEALIRWQHPKRGLIPPDDFIPIAEEIGLITPIGQWVLRQACQQLKHWHSRSSRRTPLVVSVNLSAEQFQHKTLNEQVRRILAETDANARHLKFEITESVLIEHTESTIAEMARLRDLNIQFYMDDFGTGYSSLSYLRRLHVDKLKIDKSFISRIHRRGKDLEIVRNIVRLAHGLNMGVIAEGIETAAQLASLKHIGCDYGQGFHFSRPVSSDAANVLIEQGLHGSPPPA